MSFLSRLFGSKTGPASGSDVEARLAELEKQAEKARPGYVGSALNRAGDLALKSDQPDRAVQFYGRAIDAFLDDAQRELARGVANKIIRVRPTAIRTLCTITWLDLAAQHQASALMHLRDYVTAADEAGQQARAATQIHLMAASSPDSEFIAAVADALDALDYPRRANEVRGWITIGAPGAVDDALAISDICMKAAVRSNDRDIPLLVDDPEEGVDTPDADATADSESAGQATADGDDEGSPAEAAVDGADSGDAEEHLSDQPAADVEQGTDAAQAAVADQAEEAEADQAEAAEHLADAAQAAEADQAQEVEGAAEVEQTAEAEPTPEAGQRDTEQGADAEQAAEATASGEKPRKGGGGGKSRKKRKKKKKR